MSHVIQRMCSAARRFSAAGLPASTPLKAVLAGVALCLVSTTCWATEYREVVDERPQQVGNDLWRFAVEVGVRPVGALQFVSAQYDFAYPTQGIEVDYSFDGAGIDYEDGRVFYAIAPTLYDERDGFINGWNLSDLGDGIFRGVVHATAPLTAVHFTIIANQLVPVRSTPPTGFWGR